MEHKNNRRIEENFWSSMKGRKPPDISDQFEKRVMKEIRKRKSSLVSWNSFSLMGQKAWQILPLAASVTIFFMVLSLGLPEKNAKYTDESLWMDSLLGMDSGTLWMNGEGGGE